MIERVGGKRETGMRSFTTLLCSRSVVGRNEITEQKVEVERGEKLGPGNPIDQLKANVPNVGFRDPGETA